MDSKEVRPQIKIDYLLKNEDRDSSSLFFVAGKNYAKTRSPEEEFEMAIKYHKTISFVTYGRKVLETLSAAEVLHEAELMHTDIEGRIAQLAGPAVSVASFAGYRFSGSPLSQE